MSFIQNLFSSRDNNANTQTYVGQTDRIWYNPDNNTFRVSDGNTPGGLPIDYSSGANITVNNVTANNISVNTISNDDSTEVKFLSDVTFDDEVSVNGNLTIAGNISPASNVKIGGVRAGPGANISNTGLLTIDTAGLPLSFGDFTANVNILTMVNVDQNMILATQGNAEIQLVGNIGFYKTNGLPPNISNRFFFAQDDGQVQFIVPNTDPVLGAVEIVGSASGNSIPPGIVGAMLHVTGQIGDPCRLYYDGNGDYVSWVARRFNGNVNAPTQVLAGEDVLRINSTAATNLGGGNVGNVAMAQIRTTALENQTATAQGSSITFTVTPVGQPATNRVDVANVTVANGVTATKFTTTGNISGGNLNLSGNITADYVQANNFGNVGNVEIEAGDTYWYFNTDNTFTGNGNIIVDTVTANLAGTATTATNLAAATSILAGQLNIDPAAIGKNTSSTQTFTLTGLTTSHKVVVMPQAALPFNLVISAAWASATNTLSLQFQEFGGGVDPAAFNLAYFAWV
jgi:hypothetical protein